MEAFSLVVAASFVAVGAGFDTFHVNVCDVVPWCGSTAVIVTEYGPLTDALPAIVPVMIPVVGLIDNPGGRFDAENVSGSEASGSPKLLETSASLACCRCRSASRSVLMLEHRSGPSR